MKQKRKQKSNIFSLGNCIKVCVSVWGCPSQLCFVMLLPDYAEYIELSLDLMEPVVSMLKWGVQHVELGSREGQYKVAQLCQKLGISHATL